MRRLCTVLFVLFVSVLPGAAATVDGMRIHSTVTGKGAHTIVFVHGWTCDSSSWQGQVGPLSQTYRVVTLDLPGHGQSGSPSDGKFSMDLFARAVEAVRTEVKADRIVLVGHSMGAPVIRQYARLYPQHVAGLVAVDGPLTLPPFAQGRGGQPPQIPQFTGPEGLKARETMIRTMFTPQTPPQLQQQILDMMLKAPEATAVGAMSTIFDQSVWKDDVVNAPTYAIVAGTAQLPNVEATKKVIPDFDATQVAGTGHFVMMEKPEEFNKLLTAFLDRIKF
jgi:pimeloyl-ACP methyl ester carboxylesterase